MRKLILIFITLAVSLCVGVPAAQADWKYLHVYEAQQALLGWPGDNDVWADCYAMRCYYTKWSGHVRLSSTRVQNTVTFFGFNGRLMAVKCYISWRPYPDSYMIHDRYNYEGWC